MRWLSVVSLGKEHSCLIMSLTYSLASILPFLSRFPSSGLFSSPRPHPYLPGIHISFSFLRPCPVCEMASKLILWCLLIIRFVILRLQFTGGWHGMVYTTSHHFRLLAMLTFVFSRDLSVYYNRLNGRCFLMDRYGRVKCVSRQNSHFSLHSCTDMFPCRD